MGTIEAQKLLNKWKIEELTVEMAIGHIVQHLVILHDINQQAGQSRTQIKDAIAAINITLANLRADVDALIAHTGMPPDQKPRRRPGRPPKQK
jgi:hypothetical protein